MSVVGVIATLSTSDADGGYIVTRYTNEGYDPATGDARPAVETTLQIDAVILPVTGKQLAQRQEGRHTEDTISIYTEVELRVVSRAAQADTLVYRGDTYELLRVEGPYHLGGGTHFECYAARIEAP